MDKSTLSESDICDLFTIQRVGSEGPELGAVSDEQVREVVRIAGDMNCGFVVQEEAQAWCVKNFTM